MVDDYEMVLREVVRKWSKRGPKRGHTPDLPRARAEIHGKTLLESHVDRGFSFRLKKHISESNAIFSEICRFLVKNGPKRVQKWINTSLLGVPLFGPFLGEIWGPLLGGLCGKCYQRPMQLYPEVVRKWSESGQKVVHLWSIKVSRF